jgi:hypothetical protein
MLLILECLLVELVQLEKCIKRCVGNVKLCAEQREVLSGEAIYSRMKCLNSLCIAIPLSDDRSCVRSRFRKHLLCARRKNVCGIGTDTCT